MAEGHKKASEGRSNIEHAHDIPQELQRRLVRFLNAARLPEDLSRDPQRLRHIRSEHDHRQGQPEVKHDHLVDHQEKAIFREAFAVEIIRQRPPLGWRELGMLAAIHREMFPELVDFIDQRLGPRRFGKWSMPRAIPTQGDGDAVQNAALLRTGKVLLITNGTNTILWSPNSRPFPRFHSVVDEWRPSKLELGSFKVLNSAATGLTENLFCSGHSFLSDGKLLVVGGGGGNVGTAASQHAWKFDPDPTKETWQRTAGNMAYKRWYPTVLTLGDQPGRALVASGWIDYDSESWPPEYPAPVMEVYSETTDSFAEVSVTGPVGEKIFPQTYPGLHLLPGGQVFYAPVGFGNCNQTAGSRFELEESGYFVFSDSLTGHWTNMGSIDRVKGMSVLLLDATSNTAQILAVGGGDDSHSAQGQLIDVTNLTASWRTPFPLLHKRVHPNVVLLPDGKVFICGGMESAGDPPTGGPCELFDPVASTLTEMADVNYPRHYHSVALLLPSGQVFAAGGAQEGGCSLSVENTVEVFDPPYLHKGGRPTVTAAPNQIGYGTTFAVDTPEADDIGQVVLMRPMAVTHQTDTEQRRILLQFARVSATRIDVTMPGGAASLAPAGCYMLFLLNKQRIPSTARFVRLQ